MTPHRDDMGKCWRFLQHDADRIASLESCASVSPILAQLLLGRGLTHPVDVRAFLEVKLTGLREPELLPGIPEAAERIHAAIEARRRICIYGDYDADGMTATGLLYNCLRLLGADVGYHVPNRLDEGYGLNDEVLRRLAERGTTLVISVDCGIASVQEALTARQIGLELIVTDHHQLADQLPDAAAVVHPRLPGSLYPFGGLCGAGVAFKLAWAVCQRASNARRVSPPMRDFLVTAMGLAALGTVADVVPLIDENRILVHHGLTSLRHSTLPGVMALLEVTQLHQKPCLTSEDIGFTLAPRLNAAGRLGQAQLGVELLTTQSPDRARALAEYIHQLNSSRESLERSIYLAASKVAKERFDPDNDPALVLASPGWHAGVIGIVAGRLAEKYQRPVVMIALDAVGGRPGTGSARSAGGLDLCQALAACSERLMGFGGHAAAAGLRIDEANIDAFRAEFCEHVAREVCEGSRVAEIRIDAEAPFSQLTLKTVDQIEQLAPFGAGNPRPVLCASEVTLAEPPKRIGGGERHMAARLQQHGVTMRSVAFGQGDWVEELVQTPGPIDVAYRPVINDFRGRRNVELHIVDWRPSAVHP
jgi:single-stranded-DNA-specific exonuclease